MRENEFYIGEIKGRLSAERFEHSMNVADCARRLARLYGADEEKAYTAGIVHDILKEMPKPLLKETVIRFGGAEDKLLLSQPSLWHAAAGAPYLREELAVDDPEILSAVRWHTTGRSGMSLLEKVVFTADLISAERRYPGVDEMRALAERSLEDAMQEGLLFVIRKLCDARQPIYPATVDAYNDICMQKITI